MPRSEFVKNVEVPHYELHFNKTADKITPLITGGKYNVSIPYAVNAFSAYRMKVLTWVYGIKETSLTMTKNAVAPELALSTVVFNVFNTILERLDFYHEKLTTSFENAIKKMLEVGEQDENQREHKVMQVLRRLNKNLKQYETMVRKTQSMLRSTLSFL